MIEGRGPAGLEAWLGGMVADGEASAAIAVVAVSPRPRQPFEVVSWAAAGGVHGDAPAPDLSTRFDLASLTKCLTATLALTLDEAGVLPLTARVGDLVSGAPPALSRRHLATLLRHRAGFRPWTPLALRCRTVSEVVPLLLGDEALHGARPGTYSDLGPILWGRLASLALDEPLDVLIARHLAGPLGLEGLESMPADVRDVASCTLDNGAEVRLAAEQGIALPAERVTRRGVVQDGNARFLGGLAGHAGLFGHSRDLLRVISAWLDPGALFSKAAAARALGGRGAHALAWARRRVRGSAGPALPPAAYGHVGFTGTSWWLDPDRRRAYLLLAHRRDSSLDFNRRRRAFHRWAAAV